MEAWQEWRSGSWGREKKHGMKNNRMEGRRGLLEGGKQKGKVEEEQRRKGKEVLPGRMWEQRKWGRNGRQKRGHQIACGASSTNIALGPDPTNAKSGPAKDIQQNDSYLGLTLWQLRAVPSSKQIRQNIQKPIS